VLILICVLYMLCLVTVKLYAVSRFSKI